MTQAKTLVEELVATHESFLSAVLGMVQVSNLLETLSVALFVRTSNQNCCTFQDEINLVLTMRQDPSGLDTYRPQLESMLQNQSSLISDLRECFQTYESIQATELGEQLQTHRTVLTAILDIIKVRLLIGCVRCDMN